MAVQVPAGDRRFMHADVSIPSDVSGLVLFAHGSGSSRHSPRNCFVASELNEEGFATVLADLLTEEEERIDEITASMRFDIPLLTRRVITLIDWTREHPSFGEHTLGLFGASTGAAAALDAAAARPEIVKAVVLRGGRPDLAEQLEKVQAPTLLIVGGEDAGVIELNALALRRLQCTKRLELVPGATHLFEEPGTLERVASLASGWFTQHLAKRTLAVA
jgi:dienelactone hydrolase